jgi:glucose-6-phosphate isomerase
MPLQQSIENARAERIGTEGVAAADFAAALTRTGETLEWLRARHADGGLPLLRLPAARDDLAAVNAAAARLADGASDIVILGTGGSSLGGQTLAQLADHGVPGLGALRQGPRLHFMDNLDADTFGSMLAKLPLASSRFVAISKSGGTAETLMQTIAALSAVKDAGLAARITELFLGLTEPAKSGKPNGLRTLFAEHGVTMLDHDTGVGGRYSVLTNVGLLPAALLGLDLAAIRAGAANALAPVLERRAPAEVPAAVGAAIAVALAETRGKSIAVLMAYADRLERFPTACPLKSYLQLEIYY